MSSTTRAYLVVEYDITGLSQSEVDALTSEACAQSEAVDDWHPEVFVTTRIEYRSVEVQS